MTPSLTPEQMEEAVEAMARAIFVKAPSRYERDDFAFQPPEIKDQARGYARAALLAALPVIRRAVWLEAEQVAESAYEPSHNATGTLLHRINAANVRGVEIAKRLRALAEEAR